MNNILEIEQIFKSLGGEWISSPSVILGRLKDVKAFVFDWDGVFNSGFKGGEEGSPFSEVDSMGTNMLRFGYWMENSEMPFAGIITGEHNPSAQRWAQREHFHTVYFKCADKMQAMNHFCYTHKIEPKEVAYFFDDILDLRVASMVGVRIMIGRQGSPLLTRKARQSGWADYITANSGDTGAVREGCEMLMGLLEVYDKSVNSRIAFDYEYKAYLNLRKQITCQIFSVSEEGIRAQELHNA